MLTSRLTARLAAIVLMCGTAAPVLAQDLYPAGSQAQRDAVGRLAFLDGEWRGTATTYSPGGTAVVLTQTERIGPILGGSVRVIEGRGYTSDGETAFNALAIVTWDDRAGRYNFRTYANGRYGDYPFEVTEDGFRWETPAGAGARVVYSARVRDGEWDQTGDYVVDGQPPRRIIELDLRRVGDSGWPAAGAVAAE